MAVDITQQAYQAIHQAIQKILGSRDEAAAYAEDPKGYLAGEGIADHDLSGVDVQQAVQQAAYDADLPPQTRQALQQSYAGGDGGGAGGGGGYAPPPAAPPGTPAADQLVPHVNHVTHVTYQGDDYITQQLINQENYDYSSYADVDLEGKFYGDVEVDASTVTATDGGVAATDYAEVTAATGDQAVAAGEDVYGAATGDGAVAAGEDIEAPVNTGELTGAQAGGDIGTSQVGDGTTALGDVADSNVNLGGHQSNVANSSLNESAVGGGDVTTSKTANAEDGSAVAFGSGQAAGDQQTNVQAYDSNVQTGDGYQAVDQSQTEIDQSINDSYHEDSHNQEQDVDLKVSVNEGDDAYGDHKGPYGAEEHDASL